MIGFQVVRLNMRTAADKVFDNFLQFWCHSTADFALLGIMCVEEKTEGLGFNTVQAAGVIPNFGGQILGVLFSDHCQF